MGLVDLVNYTVAGVLTIAVFTCLTVLIIKGFKSYRKIIKKNDRTYE